MGEPRAGLRLQLVVRDVLGRERKRFIDVEPEIGGALAGDAVQEVDRYVVKVGITEIVEGTPDVVRSRLTLEHLQEVLLEALRSERDPRHTARAQELRQLRRHRLGVRLHRQLQGRRHCFEQPPKGVGIGEGRRSPAEEDGLEPAGEHRPFELELGQERLDVTLVQAVSPHDRHEVAIAAAVSTERQVHVQVADETGHRQSQASGARSPARRPGRQTGVENEGAPTW
jgi:hypothetical protein